MPTRTAASVTAGLPLVPLIGVGPSAESVQSFGSAVPPWVLLTCLISVSVGATAVLVIVHVALLPTATVTAVPVEAVPPVHIQAEAV